MIPEDVRMAVLPYLNKLADFDTAEAIREFLVGENIQSSTGATRCAIAEYVRRGSGEEVSVHRTTTLRRRPSSEPVSLSDWWFMEPQYDRIADHSAAMKEFVENFDNHLYPELRQGAQPMEVNT